MAGGASALPSAAAAQVRASYTHTHTGASEASRSAAPAPSHTLLESSPALSRLSRLRGTLLVSPLLQAALFEAVKVPRRAKCLAGIRAALEAGADVNATDVDGWTPLGWAVWFNTDAAAVEASVGALLAAGADVLAHTDQGSQALHLAATNIKAEPSAAGVQALLAAGSDALAKNYDGRMPLYWVLYYEHLEAAETLLRAMPADAVLENLAASGTPLALQLLTDYIAGCLPLTESQWAEVPTPLPGLGRALPAALASSVDQARLLVRHLSPPDSQRLRTAALCLSARPHLSKHVPELNLPAVAVHRILSLCLSPPLF